VPGDFESVGGVRSCNPPPQKQRAPQVLCESTWFHLPRSMLGLMGQSRDAQSQRPPPEREDEAPVRVVVRSRPLNAIEKSDGCRFVAFFGLYYGPDLHIARSCLQLPGGNTILLGKDKAFTYDSVYGELAGQSSIFDDWVVGLVDGCFQGTACFVARLLYCFTFSPSRLQRHGICVWADRQWENVHYGRRLR
jgi:hypothetical protein